MKALISITTVFLFILGAVAFFYLTSNHPNKGLHLAKVTGEVGNLISNGTVGDLPNNNAEAMVGSNWKNLEIKFKPVACMLSKHYLPDGLPVWYVQAVTKSSVVSTVAVTAVLTRPDNTIAHQKLYHRQSSALKRLNEVYGTYITRLSSPGIYIISLLIDAEEEIVERVGRNNFTQTVTATKHIPCGNITISSSYADESRDYFPPAPIGNIKIMWVNPSKEQVALSWTATGDDLYEGKVSYYILVLTKGKLHEIGEKLDKSVRLEDLTPSSPGTLERYKLILPEFGKYDEVNFYLMACDEAGKCSKSKEETLTLHGRMMYATEGLMTKIPQNLKEIDQEMPSHHLHEKRFLSMQRKIEIKDENEPLPLSAFEEFGEELNDMTNDLAAEEADQNSQDESTIRSETVTSSEAASTRLGTAIPYDNSTPVRIIVVRQVVIKPDRMSFYMLGTGLMVLGLAFLLVIMVYTMRNMPQGMKYFWILKRTNT